jgi:hypothetical protein
MWKISEVTTSTVMIAGGFVKGPWSHGHQIHDLLPLRERSKYLNLKLDGTSLGFTPTAPATGLYMDFNVDSSQASVVLYQLVSDPGGVLLSAMVPAVQATHPKANVTMLTSTRNFYRTFISI